MTLKRKQIYVDPESDRKIKKLARATGLPEAEHKVLGPGSFYRRLRQFRGGEKAANS